LPAKGQRQEIVKNITTVTPKSFGIDDDYWTVAILAKLIKKQYNVQYKSRISIAILFDAEDEKF